MKKQKTTTRKPRARRSLADGQNLPYEKAAIRSHAFGKAILDAKAYTTDPAQLDTLFREASRKAATLPREPFRDTWPYFQTMLRLVRAYHQGHYRLVPQDALLTIVAALNYLIDPFDLIPDEIPFLGFIDDATVIAFAVSRSRDALDEFMIWETSEA